MKYLISTAAVLSRLAGFAFSQNANLSVDEKYTNFLSRTCLCTFKKEFSKKKMGNLRNELFQLLKRRGIKLHFYRQRTNFPKKRLIEILVYQPKILRHHKDKKLS